MGNVPIGDNSPPVTIKNDRCVEKNILTIVNDSSGNQNYKCLSEFTAERPGYAFRDWNTQSDCNGITITPTIDETTGKRVYDVIYY